MAKFTAVIEIIADDLGDALTFLSGPGVPEDLNPVTIPYWMTRFELQEQGTDRRFYLNLPDED